MASEPISVESDEGANGYLPDTASSRKIAMVWVSVTDDNGIDRRRGKDQKNYPFEQGRCADEISFCEQDAGHDDQWPGEIKLFLYR